MVLAPKNGLRLLDLALFLQQEHMVQQTQGAFRLSGSLQRDSPFSASPPSVFDGHVQVSLIFMLPFCQSMDGGAAVIIRDSGSAALRLSSLGLQCRMFRVHDLRRSGVCAKVE